MTHGVMMTNTKGNIGVVHDILTEFTVGSFTQSISDTPYWSLQWIELPSSNKH